MVISFAVTSTPPGNGTGFEFAKLSGSETWG